MAKKTHKVEQGECIPTIAQLYGIRKWETLWNDSANSQLKSKRKNPNILMPGDLVVIPELKEKQEARGTGASHNFTLPTGKGNVKIKLLDISRNPIKNAECVVTLGQGAQGNDTLTLTTNGAGEIEFEVPFDKNKQIGTLTLTDPNLPFDTRMGVKVSHLDPITEVSGQVARLNNLGYRAGKIPVEDQQQFKSAVEEFQCDNKLTVDGDCGSKTQEKLKKEHGC